MHRMSGNRITFNFGHAQMPLIGDFVRLPALIAGKRVGEPCSPARGGVSPPVQVRDAGRPSDRRRE
jgi:hypothetical protein